MSQINLIAVLGLASLLAGCTQSNDELNQFIDDTNKSARATLDPIPSYKPVESIEYSGELIGRDPFTRHDAISQKAERALRKRENRILDPLEKFELNTFTYLGYIDDITTGNRKILLKSGDGQLHNAYVNDRIGPNNGRIARVTDDYIVIAERVRDENGHYVTTEKQIFQP